MSYQEIQTMRRAGKVAAAVLKNIKRRLRPGISTKDIEIMCVQFLSRYKAMEPAFKGFQGFPSSVCVSVNEEIIHGIPSSKKVIQKGDLVSVDLGVKYIGLYVDTACTYIVGKASCLAKKLIKVTYNALQEGIKKVKIGAKVGDISSAIQQFVEARGFSVIRKFVGHGIGRKLHSFPEIPNFGQPGTGDILKEGMVIAIEPMVSVGGYEVDILADGWTAKTRDNSLSAHFEHTVAVTRRGAKIITR